MPAPVNLKVVCGKRLVSERWMIGRQYQSSERWVMEPPRKATVPFPVVSKTARELASPSLSFAASGLDSGWSASAAPKASATAIAAAYFMIDPILPLISSTSCSCACRPHADSSARIIPQNRREQNPLDFLPTAPRSDIRRIKCRGDSPRHAQSRACLLVVGDGAGHYPLPSPKPLREKGIEELVLVAIAVDQLLRHVNRRQCLADFLCRRKCCAVKLPRCLHKAYLRPLPNCAFAATPSSSARRRRPRSLSFSAARKSSSRPT